ncbi:hypothetical protein LCGC14_1916250 [marine sediment metagenome]|uniref:Uncharacterized protein n=1 Tax=marine sediment metagenome TaxID=412755 RepID=A0A0F9FSX7_9ZZZZ
MIPAGDGFYSNPSNGSATLRLQRCRAPTKFAGGSDPPRARAAARATTPTLGPSAEGHKESPPPRGMDLGGGWSDMKETGAMIQQPHMPCKPFSTTSWWHNTPKSIPGNVRRSGPRLRLSYTPTFLDILAPDRENVALYPKCDLLSGGPPRKYILMSQNICRFLC